MADDDLCATAFGSAEWREAIDALFEARGLVVTVMDRDARALVCAVHRCSYCEVVVPEQPGVGCVTPTVRPVDSVREAVCRAGLPCFVAPVSVGGRALCTLCVGGFVSSTRERGRLVERAVGSGLDEAAVRAAARSIPIVSRREAEATTRMVVALASGVLGRASENTRWAARVRELELFVEASTTFRASGKRDSDVEGIVLDRAIAIVSGDCGSIMMLRPGTDMLVVVATRGEACSGAMNECVHVGEGIAGRVAHTGRTVLIAGDKGDWACHSMKPGRGITQALSVPLHCDGQLIGVLNIGVTDTARRFSGEEVRLIDRFATMASVVIDNARRHRRADRANFELLQLSEFAKSLGGANSIEDVTSATASVLEKAFDFDLTGVIVTGWGCEDVTVVLGEAVPRNAIDVVVAEAAGWSRVDPMPNSMRLVTHRAEPTADAVDVGDWSVLTSELIVRGTLVGVLFLASRTEGVFDAVDKRLLDGVAEHVAIALDRTVALATVRDDYARTVAALAAAVDAGEAVPRGHSDRVMDYAMAIGERLALAREDIEVLRFAGLLHDIGKVGLSEEILLKPSRLTEEEMEQVRRHAEIGASIVEQLEFLHSVTPVIRHHHERWDGHGYPKGLAGEDIPLLARILAVADAFDVMTSDRPYRRKLSYAEARRELLAGAGTQFDPTAVTALIEALDARALAGGTGLFADEARTRDLPV